MKTIFVDIDFSNHREYALKFQEKLNNALSEVPEDHRESAAIVLGRNYDSDNESFTTVFITYERDPTEQEQESDRKQEEYFQNRNKLLELETLAKLMAKYPDYQLTKE
jgi:cell division GTPase FtsZ